MDQIEGIEVSSSVFLRMPLKTAKALLNHLTQTGNTQYGSFDDNQHVLAVREQLRRELQ